MAKLTGVQYRDRVIRARLTESERAKLEAMAAQDGESLSVFLRRLIRQEAETRLETLSGDGKEAA